MKRPAEVKIYWIFLCRKNSRDSERSNGNQKQSESTVKIANELGLQPEYWFKYSLHPNVKKYIEI